MLLSTWFVVAKTRKSPKQTTCHTRGWAVGLWPRAYSHFRDDVRISASLRPECDAASAMRCNASISWLSALAGRSPEQI
jgi:hypothetical protein